MADCSSARRVEDRGIRRRKGRSCTCVGMSSSHAASILSAVAETRAALPEICLTVARGGRTCGQPSIPQRSTVWR
eukprot:7809565-Pyramimonas_sp.AAC.1